MTAHTDGVKINKKASGYHKTESIIQEKEHDNGTSPQNGIPSIITLWYTFHYKTMVYFQL